MAFPTTGILDTGVRANEGPPPSASWDANGVNGANALTISSNKISATSGQSGCWGTQYGPDSENYVTVSTLPADTGQMNLHLRLQQIGGATVDGYRLLFSRKDSFPGYTVIYQRLDNNVVTTLGAQIDNTAGAISAGVKFGIEMVGSTLTAYVNKSGTWVAEATRSDSTYTGAGYIGLRVTATSAFNDFGGGNYSTGSDTGLAWITA